MQSGEIDMALMLNTYTLQEREREREKLSYEKQFYTIRFNGKYNTYQIYGFPCMRGQWCTSRLKTDAVDKCRKANIRENVLSDTQPKNTDKSGKDKRLSGTAECSVVRKAESKVFSQSSLAQGAKKNIVQYLGIAADEPERIKRHSVPGKMLPLVDIGWDEAYCRQWCEENDLLSPIYTTATRGGCWFCHNQGVDQLRLLRKNYPDLWQLLLKWDKDSPTTFKSDGHTVHDFEKRFEAEDKGIVKAGDKKFRWKQVLQDEKKEVDK